MPAYYNENNAYVAAWLRNLIAAQLIPAGDVDERSVADVAADDLRGYRQAHFFAGIGGWPLGLRLAGWPDDLAVWTGSCPCQPISSAAHGRNVAVDLWPVWLKLIAARRPRTLFGEQVAHCSGWIDRACDDLEALDYQVGAAPLPAVSVGEDHIRHRLYFVGHADRDGQPGVRLDAEVARLQRDRGLAGGLVSPHGVSARMAVMGAFGNAIVPQLAAEFIAACADVI